MQFTVPWMVECRQSIGLFYMSCMREFAAGELIGPQWNLPTSGSKMVHVGKTPAKLTCVHEEHSNQMRLLSTTKLPCISPPIDCLCCYVLKRHSLVMMYSNRLAHLAWPCAVRHTSTSYVIAAATPCQHQSYAIHSGAVWKSDQAVIYDDKHADNHDED